MNENLNLLFIHEIRDRGRICIKFGVLTGCARDMCANVCRSCVAPKLRGLEDIGAEWNMVIVNTLDEAYV
jgi:hypothetical protein